MVRRGDIVRVCLDPVVGSEQGKTRPAIVIQHDALNTTSSTTIVVPITSKIYDKEYPMHVKMLEKKFEGTIKVEQIRTIDISRIKKVEGVVSSEVMMRIGKALQMTCDFF